MKKVTDWITLLQRVVNHNLHNTHTHTHVTITTLHTVAEGTYNSEQLSTFPCLV